MGFLARLLAGLARGLGKASQAAGKAAKAAKSASSKTGKQLINEKIGSSKTGKQLINDRLKRGNVSRETIITVSGNAQDTVVAPRDVIKEQLKSWGATTKQNVYKLPTMRTESEVIKDGTTLDHSTAVELAQRIADEFREDIDIELYAEKFEQYPGLSQRVENLMNKEFYEKDVLMGFADMSSGELFGVINRLVLGKNAA